ncbi:flavodoxin [Rhizobium lusitanum]|uniref:flavodoxin n=2 Tax=Rhizobium TaxID=379 RepID=UPI00195DB5E4|nr:flavodoxin [Rhizobium lusitanum]MBM7046705.1 flavodoxin [Rhizobium lusitanum]
MQLSRRTVLTSMMAVATAPHWAFAVERRRVLVAYYSYTGNTKSVAERVSALVGGELLEIKMADPYPLDIRRMAEQSKYELETGEFPPLRADPPDMSDYDLILVGGPVWWNTVSAPVMSFLERVNFAGRRVGLFSTYALTPSHYETNFAAQARNATIQSSLMINEFDIAGGRANDAIASWAFRASPKDGPRTL